MKWVINWLFRRMVKGYLQREDEPGMMLIIYQEALKVYYPDYPDILIHHMAKEFDKLDPERTRSKRMLEQPKTQYRGYW